MNLAYFDCFHGAAGDMLLASLLDAGLELAALERVLTAGLLPGLHPATFTIEHQRVVSHHIGGSRVVVHTHEPVPRQRTWADIRQILQAGNLPASTRNAALRCFERLARAEAAVHRVEIEAVHFHEVGAIDSIVDIVGVCAGLELLGIEHVFASALPTGRGWVTTQHGSLPVPAPATLALLAEAGAPTVPPVSDGEVLTPTAAALLTELAQFGQPMMQVRRVGYGFGHKQFSRLNGLRVWLGDEGTGSSDQTRGNREMSAEECKQRSETVVELRCNLDDVTGEVVAYAIEQLLAAGALDAWAAPLVMKKGRPAVQLACLCRPADTETLAQLMLHETPTLGVRHVAMGRMVAERRTVYAETPWGTVRVKQKIVDGVVIGSAPEYEDYAALARMHGVALSEVYAAALAAHPQP